MSSPKCASCDKQRFELKNTASKLLPTMKFLLCNDCIAKGWEPRWAVVMAAQQFGNQHVRAFVSKKKYAGNPIAFEEVVV